jgi:hypothetical protein
MPTPEEEKAAADAAKAKAKADAEAKAEADKLGEPGKKALDEERKARRDAEKQLKDIQDKLKELEDKDKSEVEKLRGDVEKLTKDRDDSAAKALRLEVGVAKGLTPAQARRLVGGTKEELESDADSLLDDFKPAEDKPSGSRPKERLRPGSVPDAEPEETDPRKLAEALPRN